MLPGPSRVDVGRMATVSRPHGLGRAELAASLQKPPPIRVPVANLLSVDSINIESKAGIVAGISAMRRPSQSCNAESISSLGKITHRPKHPRIKPHITTRRSAVATPFGCMPRCSLVDIVQCRCTVVSPANLTRQPSNGATPLQPARHV